ncbi:Hypothetical protein, putative [Bodo saltans]|uniref:Uncharacterized protein n=1 Tax=Bodo saltans TaxID=75058 RepID=A0A0S4JF01_BODSA|nr:Hypothetical protein, putative [Bodo saltans]|eukprot:CUG86963.1 Hypothetical protein, putative [Bodo saltans]
MKRVSNGRNVVFVPYVDNIPPPPPQQQQYRERLQQQQQQQQQQQRAPHVASLVSNEANNKSCASRPIKTNAIFRLHMKDHIETLRMTANFNRKFMFDKYGLPPSHAFAHYPGLYDRTILSRMLDEELRDIARKTAADRFRTQDTMWMTMVYPFAALAHRRGVDTALAADHLRLWTRSTSYEHLSLTVSNVGPLVDPNFGKLSKSYQGNMFLSTKAAALANVRPITATLGTIGHEILNEKLRYWLVNMDGKCEPMYSFCMMTVNSLTGCYRDLHNKMKLFVTANDDLASADPVSVNTVHALLRLVSRDAAPAPWERR